MSRDTGRVTEAQIRRELLRTSGQAARKRARIGAAVVLGAALLAGALALRFLYALVDVRTDGMADTLQSGDVALCERADSPLASESPARGALALVRYSDNGLQRQTVRRVIALAGDEVRMEPDGHAVVNGELLEEPYATYRTEIDWNGGDSSPGGALENPFASEQYGAVAASEETVATIGDDLTYPITVPEGWLFVLCDNRENAMDSRSSGFGLVSEANVLGYARLVVWPAHRAGTPLTDAGANGAPGLLAGLFGGTDRP